MSRKERRKHPRFDSVNAVSYVCFNQNEEAVQEGKGRTWNVGQGGILLETQVPIDHEHVVSLAISGKDSVIDVKGEPVHSRTMEDGKVESGIQFIDLDEPTLQVIREFIKSVREQNTASGG